MRFISAIIIGMALVTGVAQAGDVKYVVSNPTQFSVSISIVDIEGDTVSLGEFAPNSLIIGVRVADLEIGEACYNVHLPVIYKSAGKMVARTEVIVLDNHINRFEPPRSLRQAEPPVASGNK